jgi:hypothetical protein
MMAYTEIPRRDASAVLRGSVFESRDAAIARIQANSDPGRKRKTSALKSAKTFIK